MGADAHHHKETFITKYIFSQDHKMISKQYLITGLIMGIVGIAMSLLFRLQLAWPEQPFGIFESTLGKWAPDGVMDPNVYLALVTIHGTIMVFFVLTAGLSGTFSNLLIPLQIGARDMASGFLNMVSYWLFSCQVLSCLPHYLLKQDQLQQDGRFTHHSAHCHKHNPALDLG